MKQHSIKTPLSMAAMAVTLALAAPSVAQQQSGSNAQQSGSSKQQNNSQAQQQKGGSKNAQSSSQPNPYARADDTWITLSGTVENVGPNSFALNYGDGRVTVEMDDNDRDADGYALRNGDKVTVAGLIDDDLFETTSIEASSVYVEKLGTYFYASATDEEDMPVMISSAVVDPSAAAIVGMVTSVNGNEFVLDRGTRSITVEVDNMAYDPLDNEGYQRVEVGDIVSVAGNIDNDFFEGRELEATSIITLFNHAG